VKIIILFTWRESICGGRRLRFEPPEHNRFTSYSSLSKMCLHVDVDCRTSFMLHSDTTGMSYAYFRESGQNFTCILQ